MPNTEANQNYDDKTEKLSFLMVLSTVYTLALSLIFSKAIKKLISTMFTLQLVINSFLLSLAFPGNIVNVIKKIKPLISFDILKSLT